MLKIMVVERRETRRADIVDAICELPGVLSCGAASGFLDALKVMATHQLDAMVVGNVPDRERKLLATVAKTVARCEVISADDASEAIVRVAALELEKRSEAATASMQTVVVQDWLPAMCARFAPMMPAHVELVPIIAGNTPPVRCVPETLEHEVRGIVLEAAAKLPWGGTIWLTSELAGDDTVRIDVLENGLGTGGDVTLRTAAPASS